MLAYIAGGMSGIKDFNFPAFDAAKRVLQAQGYDVLSPADFDRRDYPNHDWSSQKTPKDFDYAESLIYDLKMIKQCDAIYMLPGWQGSKGAQVEHKFALALGIPRYYFSPEDLTFPESVV